MVGGISFSGLNRSDHEIVLSDHLLASSVESIRGENGGRWKSTLHSTGPYFSLRSGLCSQEVDHLRR
jgi:hypothetical protein